MKNWIMLLFILSNLCYGQIKKDTVIDLGYGLFDTVSQQEFQNIKKEKILCINYLSNNNITFKHIGFTSNKKSDFRDKEFNYKNGKLTIYKDETSTTTIIDKTLILHSYYTFSCNDDDYQYFIFLTENLGGNINKLYTGFLVKNKETFIYFPHEVSTTNPAILFRGGVDSELSNTTIYLIGAVVDFSNKIKLYALKNKVFEIENKYFITTEPSDYKNYNYKIDINNSKWFKNITY